MKKGKFDDVELVVDQDDPLTIKDRGNPYRTVVAECVGYRKPAAIMAAEIVKRWNAHPHIVFLLQHMASALRSAHDDLGYDANNPLREWTADAERFLAKLNQQPQRT